MGSKAKHIRELLEFFEEFRHTGFENCCNNPKQMPTGLELNLKIAAMDRKKPMCSQGRMDTYICMVESPPCPPETTITLLIGYTLMQKKKLQVWQK